MKSSSNTKVLCLAGGLVLFLALALPVQAGVWDTVKSMMNEKTTSSTGNTQEGTTGTSSLSQEEIVKGLKEALDLGAKEAVQMASKEGGFLNNPEIRIPLPSKVQTIASVLEKVGYGDKVQAFQVSMNRAAEQAAAKALPIFTQAIKDMTFDDAVKIWKGGDTAATQYFQEKTSDSLYQAFKPVIHDAMQKEAVTKKYQDMVNVSSVKTMASMVGTNLDLDDYVTRGTLKGLFTLLAQEEKKIRENPAAQTTDLLKKVFGSLSK